jgi:DNA repair protein RadC
MNSITHPKEAVKLAKPLITDWHKEHTIGIYLNARSIPTKVEVISIGTLNATLVHPRETFRPALVNHAASLIFLHNHPSGGVEPSEADLELTKRLEECGKILGIELVDHIIFTKTKCKSIMGKEKA